MSHRSTRRQFVRSSAALAAGVAVSGNLTTASASADEGRDFASRWHKTPARVWPGPEYWTNRLQDWRIAEGRLECIAAAPDRNVHLLTRELSPQLSSFVVSVRLGRLGGRFDQGGGSAGFRIGIRGPLEDYRNRLIFGRGLEAGLTTQGKLFIGEINGQASTTLAPAVESIELRLTGEPQGNDFTVTLSATNAATGAVLGEVRAANIPADQLIGGVALVANFGAAQQSAGTAKASDKAGQFWFADWRVAGDKITVHEDRVFGPILFSQYTLSGGTLKMTAQMPPLGPDDSKAVRLEAHRDGRWGSLGEATIDPDARTATFKVPNWNDAVDTDYRLAYSLRWKDGTETESYWMGRVRRDPIDHYLLTVADISCNGHMLFPNTRYVENMARLNPSMLVFTGDQFYESSGGYGFVRTPLDVALLDMLRKWYLHGWTWRELMRDRPTVSIPDDHDVYQGNLWGEAGLARHGTQEMGGYDMPVEWVNAVHRTQTSHHPDPFDSTPGKRGTSVYYGALTYGRVSFAILADRQFKTGPEGRVPPTGDRGDHVVDPAFDPRTADLPGLELLGQRQLEFLRQWATDWRGADMKAVISQTIFTAMATTHGFKRERLRADYDANGWPQAARNAALREIRKALAFHIAGDQHLPAVVHYGIDTHCDAGVAFAGPPVNCIYPRWFEPKTLGKNRQEGSAANTGDFRDSFNHPLTVLAVANPALEVRRTPLEAEQDKGCGLGLCRFDKADRSIKIECWPFLADPSVPGTQFPGWPVSIEQADLGGAAEQFLPTFTFPAGRSPVLQVIDESSGQLVYNLRAPGDAYQPRVFAVGSYTVKVLDEENGLTREYVNLRARKTNNKQVAVKFKKGIDAK